MVRVIDFKERTTQDGSKTFNALILQGGVEFIESAKGGLYATVRKASVATTFDEETCKALIGKELPGTIEKVDSEPYEHVVQSTGEVLILHHRYVFVPESVKAQEEKTAILPETSFAELANVPMA